MLPQIDHSQPQIHWRNKSRCAKETRTSTESQPNTKMCPIKKVMVGESASPCGSPSTSSEHQTVWTSPPKRRPAGRTKFSSGRRGTPCSTASGTGATRVRVPGLVRQHALARHLDAAEAAAHTRTTPPCSPSPARTRASTYFADSAWLLAVPASYTDVRRTVAEAVEGYQCRETLLEEDAQSATSSTPSDDGSTTDGEEASLATSSSTCSMT